MMDGLLARASIAGQQINVYTGTDYSGIESLRNEIVSQEQKVKDCHREVESSRRGHQEAFAEQASAQREIVGLLERKASWSPTDLERYMSLVRSEHTNDQAVQVAKDNLAQAERKLEDARALLERLERKQYHEEQVWSDTIRRNSTWVTFGLMGVNILLLLAQITIFEPYRRKKIVKDVKSALDEKTLTTIDGNNPEQTLDDAGINQEMMEKFAALRDFAEKSDSLSDEQMAKILQEALQLVESVETSPQPSQPSSGIETEALPEEAWGLASRESQQAAPSTWTDRLEAYKANVRDLFSDRIVQVRKIDVTSTALQGAAAGVTATGLIALALLRFR